MTDKVIDYAWSSGFANAADIRAHGFVGVMRYISHDGSKNLTPAERDDLRAHGLSIGLVWESTANRAGRGAQAGTQDALMANQQADALGYPKDCTLWYAVDFDAAPAQVQPYFDGVGSANGRKHAPYGGFKIIEGVAYPGIGWQTVAWSGGKISARAGLIQNAFANSYDTNDVLKAGYGQWKTGDDMTPEEHAWLADLHAFMSEVHAGSATVSNTALSNFTDVLGRLDQSGIEQNPQALKAIKDELDALKAKVDSLSGGGAPTHFTITGEAKAT